MRISKAVTISVRFPDRYPLARRAQKSRYHRCLTSGHLAHALGRTLTKRHLNNQDRDLLRNAMDPPGAPLSCRSRRRQREH